MAHFSFNFRLLLNIFYVIYHYYHYSTQFLMHFFIALLNLSYNLIKMSITLMFVYVFML